MSLQDRSKEELLKQKKKYRFGVWVFTALLILTLFLYTIEQLSKSTWQVLFGSFIVISSINSLYLFRINKELKKRE